MSADRGRAVVLDSVCCVTFCATGKASLLAGILIGLELQMFVPAEVSDEITRGKATAHQRKQWLTLTNSGRVTVLPAIDPIVDTHLMGAMHGIFGARAREALGIRENRGEWCVVAQALHMQQRGDDVRVVIDDWRAQGLADDAGLEIWTIERVLYEGVRLGKIAPGEVQHIYNKMRETTGSLMPWATSDLKRLVAAFKKEQSSKVRPQRTV